MAVRCKNIYYMSIFLLPTSWLSLKILNSFLIYQKHIFFFIFLFNKKSFLNVFANNLQVKQNLKSINREKRFK